jgi:branched-chain amino acid transport system permease protein
MLLNILITGLIAIIISYPLYRLKGDYFAFATLALLPLMEVLRRTCLLLPKAEMELFFRFQKVASLAYVLALVLSFVSFILTLWINRSRFGYALRAIR